MKRTAKYSHLLFQDTLGSEGLSALHTDLTTHLSILKRHSEWTFASRLKHQSVIYKLHILQKIFTFVNIFCKMINWLTPAVSKISHNHWCFISLQAWRLSSLKSVGSNENIYSPVNITFPTAISQCNTIYQLIYQHMELVKVSLKFQPCFC